MFQRPRRFASRRASRSSQLKTGHSIAHPSDRLEDHPPRGRKDSRQILRHLRPGHGVGERSEPDLIAPPGSPVIVILTASVTVPPVTLVVVTPLLVNVLVVKLELVTLVALHLPLATTVCGTVPFAAAAMARKRVKEPLPLS